MRKLVLVPVLLVVFALLSQAALQSRIVVALYAQDAPTVNPPTFEVASVKQNKSGDPGRFFRNQPGGRFSVTNMPLKDMIQVSYGVQPFQVVGGPDWITSDRWDVVAKADGDVRPLGPPGSGPSPMALMLRSLLGDRFKLTLHRETREMPIFGLVLARADGKLGPKIERSTTDCAAMARARAGGAPQGPPPGPPKPGDRPPCGMFMGIGSIGAGSTTMTQLANLLSGPIGRIVVDKTGLEGNWAFDVEFAPVFNGPPPPGVQLPQADPNAPSIYTALEEQLGLKLDPQRGPVDVIVIDSVERPTED